MMGVAFLPAGKYIVSASDETKGEELREKDVEVRKHEEVKKREEEVKKREEEAQQKELKARQRNEALEVDMIYASARLFILLQVPESFKKLVCLQEQQAQDMMDLLQKVRLAFHLNLLCLYDYLC